MRRWWKNRKYDVIAAVIVGGISLAIFVAMLACLRWMIIQPIWGYPLAEWLKTATIGEVSLLFGSLLVVIRLLSNPSLKVKKDEQKK